MTVLSTPRITHPTINEAFHLGWGGLDVRPRLSTTFQMHVEEELNSRVLTASLMCTSVQEY